MASTFSTNLAIELIGTGDQAGTWGVTTNTNLGTLVEQAISGYVTQAVSTGADTTITIPNGATGVARNMYIELTGTGGTNTNLIVPSNKKLYFIFNNTSSGQVTVKVSGQTGVSVPNGKKMVLVCNGTDIVNGLNYIADFGTNSFTVTNLTATSANITTLVATNFTSTNQATIDGMAVGQGGGNVATNTAVGVSALAANTTGARNTAIGYQSALTNSTGVDITAIGFLAANTTAAGPNTALGARALQNSTSGVNNTAVGYATLQTTSTGNNNVGVGDFALNANTTASNNTAVGYAALLDNSTGANITAVGYLALENNTTGGANVAVGVSALGLSTTASNNTAVGYQAAYSNTTGPYTTAVGYRAGYSNSTSDQNTFVGFEAGCLTTGASNTAVGAFAYSAATTGNNNTAIGTGSMLGAVTGCFSASLGRNALRCLTSGNYNTAVGADSLFSNPTASSNTAVGYQAGYSNTTGSPNTAIGYQAGYANTTGGYNVFAGYRAGCGVTTGSFNVAIGGDSQGAANNAGCSISIGQESAQCLTGSAVVAIGHQAARYASSGSSNTAVGYFAYRGDGSTAPTGSNNTVVGYLAGQNLTTGSKNTIIGGFNGNQSGLDIRTASNRIVLSDGDGSPRFWMDNNGWSYQPGTNYQNRRVSEQGTPNLGAYKGYLLLAKAYVSGFQNVSTVFGTFFLSRGSASSGNRADIYEVNSQSAYNNDTFTVKVLASSVDTFFVRTVKVTYGGAVYHAIETTASGGQPDNGIWFQGVVNGDTGAFPIYTDETYVSSVTAYGYAEVSGRDGTQSLYLQNGRLEFPATENASSNANTLDDYEEGTWTGTLKGGTTDPTTPVTATGKYTKIGRQVTVAIYFNDVNTTGAAGSVSITGLPFSEDGTRAIGTVATYLFDFPAGVTSLYVDFSGTTGYVLASGDNVAWGAVLHSAGAGRYLRMTGTYFV